MKPFLIFCLALLAFGFVVLRIDSWVRRDIARKVKANTIILQDGTNRVVITNIIRVP